MMVTAVASPSQNDSRMEFRNLIISSLYGARQVSGSRGCASRFGGRLLIPSPQGERKCRPLAKKGGPPGNMQFIENE